MSLFFANARVPPRSARCSSHLILLFVEEVACRDFTFQEWQDKSILPYEKG